MDNETYHRLTNMCVDHFLEVLQPRLDQWAERKAKRWQEYADQAAKGRGHWQARALEHAPIYREEHDIRCQANSKSAQSCRRRPAVSIQRALLRTTCMCALAAAKINKCTWPAAFHYCDGVEVLSQIIPTTTSLLLCLFRSTR